MTFEPLALRVRGLEHRYASGRVALAGIDLDVIAGESVALMGPNGSGKTTLLRILAGDLRPTSGDLRRGGDAAIPPRLITGYAPDEAIHFDELTGRENACLFARAYGARDVAAEQMLERFGLLPDAGLPAAEYSFGMRRRLLLVEALAHAPQLLFLDEPTVGLDPAAAETLATELLNLRERGGIVVFATNDTAAATLAGRILFLHHGRKVADGTPAELLRSVEGTTRIEVELEAAGAAVPAFGDDVSATRTSRGYVFETGNGTAPLPGICGALVAANARIRAVHVREPGFADVFRRLTGEDLDSTAAAEGIGPARTAGPPWRRS